MKRRVTSRWVYLRLSMKELLGVSLTERERLYLALGDAEDALRRTATEVAARIERPLVRHE